MLAAYVILDQNRLQEHQTLLEKQVKLRADQLTTVYNDHKKK